MFREFVATGFMYAYLTAHSGPIAGNSYLLDARQQNQLGRGTECSIIVPEPRCSRVHAILWQQEGIWRLRDAESRNGTLVSGERIHEVPLKHGDQFRLGSTDFEFHLCEQTPTVSFVADAQLTQTIVRDTRVDELGNPTVAPAALGGSEQAHDLHLLFQLSTKLLASRDLQRQLMLTLELLRERTKASLVGYLWMNDAGALVPRYVLPAAAENKLPLSEALTRLVSDQGHAIWVANQQSGRAQRPEHMADAVCVPLVKQRRVQGALYAYLADGHFRQSEFDFAISLANIASLATGRTQRELSLEQRLAATEKASGEPWELGGSSAAIIELRHRIAQLGPTAHNVLLLGEAGSGEDAVARALHAASGRSDAPLFYVDCAMVPAEELDEHLFAAARPVGLPQEASAALGDETIGVFPRGQQATVYLRQFHLLPEVAQRRLLRIHQGKPVQLAAGTAPVQLTARIICSMDEDPQVLVQQQRLLPELAQALGVYRLQVPPLRERQEDLPVLIQNAIRRWGQRYGKSLLEISDEALQTLTAYSWPGNTRQLGNAIENAVFTTEGETIGPAAFSLQEPDAVYDTLRVADWERRLIVQALRQTGGNVPEAAALLGLGRATLYRKIDDYQISR